MTQKVMISAGSQAFEFEGEILELEPDYIVLRAKHGDIYIERKYLVFIQFMNEEKEPVEEKPAKHRDDSAARFVNRRLKHDPIDDIMDELMVPPSQLPDDDDMEVQRNITTGKHQWSNTTITNAPDLQQAVKTAMENEEHDFSMGAGGAKYKDPLQTILGMKNANKQKS